LTLISVKSHQFIGAAASANTSILGQKLKTTTMAPFSHPFLAFLLLILRICPLVYSLNDSIEKTASLFEPQDSIYRVGPSAFPKPTHLFPDSQHVVPVVPPIIGQHRPDKNTVFAYAEGYPVENYVLFISTLRATGFDGDIVLAIADEPKEYVVEYLSSQQHVVVYKASLACFDEDRLTPAPRTEKNGGIFQMCQLNGVYGSITSEDNTTILQDPRAGRVVATLRYEWYWIWAMKYQAESWILLLDARDSLFQTNPFTPDLPQSSTHGILYFFGESHEATRLGKSKKNVNWLRNAYGTTVLEALTEKPTICSGSTMGNQRAIETYLRAMVHEWDETDIAMTGAGKSTASFRACRLGNFPHSSTFFFPFQIKAFTTTFITAVN
jgi:hypothetical protein